MSDGVRKHWRNLLALWSFLLFWPMVMVPLSCTGLYKQYPRQAWSGVVLFLVLGILHVAMLRKPALRILADKELGSKGRILEFLAAWYLLPSLVSMLVGTGIGFGVLLIIKVTLGIDCAS